jgi:carbonic anhydrase
MISIEHDLATLKEPTVDRQEPFAAVLSELVYDQTIGQIFVTRVAGNIVTPEIIASLESGVAVLGIKAVLAPYQLWGGEVAAMKADAVSGQISALYQHLRKAEEQSSRNVAKAIALNARIQAELLRTSSTVFAAG